MPRHLALLPLALLAAACGELETPDLAHGDVTGRLAGASPGAFAYPLGAPQRKVALGADGTFTLAGLPAGPTRLVLFDGDLRAELVEVEVEGSERVRVERSAADMPFAGRAVVTVVPEGGAEPVAPTFLVRDTDQAGAATAAGAAVIFPLPGGDYELEAGLPGFQPTTGALEVRAGLTGGLEVRLPVATSGPRGCAAVGDLCRNDLKCDEADGRCYQCRPGFDDCGPGATCDPATRFCTGTGAGASAAICSACAADQDCGDVAAGAVCQLAAGAVTGYCTRLDGPAGCPAGFTTAGTPARCVTPTSCHEYFEEFGEHCFSDPTCGPADGIQGGFCRGADRDAGIPGYCTAPCQADADCIVSGFTCDPVDRVCVRSPP